MLNPPSIIINQGFNKLLKLNFKITDAKISQLARQTLLSVEDVKFWMDHLQGVHKRRKEGALKAAKTRAKKKGIFYENILTQSFNLNGICLHISIAAAVMV